MKLLRYLLPLSLLANLALLATVMLRRAPVVTGSAGRASETRQVEVRGDVEAQGAQGDRMGGRGHGSPEAPFWDQVCTEDVLELKQRLVAAGFPRRHASVVAISLLGWRTTMQTEPSTVPVAPYWFPAFYYYKGDPAQQKKAEALWAECRQLCGKLNQISEILPEDPAMQERLRHDLGVDSLEKMIRIRTIWRDYFEMQSALQKSMGTGDNAEALKDQMRVLRQEQVRDIQASLSPQEYMEYQYRNSATAYHLSEPLCLLRASEVEYKAIYALMRPIDEEYEAGKQGKEESAAHEAALKALNPQLESVLGRERYAEYVVAMDEGNKGLNTLMVRLELPLSTTLKVNAVRDETKGKGDRIEKEATISDAERGERLKALLAEAQGSLRKTLAGERGYNAYADIHGDWLRALQAKVDKLGAKR